MKFSFKITIPGGASYEEIMNIPDCKVERLMQECEFDEIMQESLTEWMWKNIEIEWEKVYGSD